MWKAKRDIRVLVVDDSGAVRALIRSMLESEPGIEVVGEAADGAEAIAAAHRLKPDLLTMDIEMPVLGGLEAIETIVAARPVPILALTALAGVRTAFEAVSRGALEVMEKRELRPDNAAKLVQKVRLLANVDVAAHRASLGRGGAPAPLKAGVSRPLGEGERLVAIAASTGGPQAIQYILSRLPADFPAPIVITQHMAEGFTQGMVDWFNGTTPLQVVVAASGERVMPGRAYVNPAEHAMRLTMQGGIVLGEKDRRLHYNPSCDTLLDSASAIYGKRCVGVILSGMGDDGVLGMQAIRAAGGVTLAQDEESSLIYGMNRVAVERGCIERVLPLSEIAAELVTRLKRG